MLRKVKIEPIGLQELAATRGGWNTNGYTVPLEQCNSVRGYKISDSNCTEGDNDEETIENDSYSEKISFI